VCSRVLPTAHGSTAAAARALCITTRGVHCSTLIYIRFLWYLTAQTRRVQLRDDRVPGRVPSQVYALGVWCLVGCGVALMV